MTYRAILFDLDDTLYDLRSYWRGRLHEVIHTLLTRGYEILLKYFPDMRTAWRGCT